MCSKRSLLRAAYWINRWRQVLSWLACTRYSMLQRMIRQGINVLTPKSSTYPYHILNHVRWGVHSGLIQLLVLKMYTKFIVCFSKWVMAKRHLSTLPTIRSLSRKLDIELSTKRHKKSRVIKQKSQRSINSQESVSVSDLEPLNRQL